MSNLLFLLSFFWRTGSPKFVTINSSEYLGIHCHLFSSAHMTTFSPKERGTDQFFSFVLVAKFHLINSSDKRGVHFWVRGTDTFRAHIICMYIADCSYSHSTYLSQP